MALLVGEREGTMEFTKIERQAIFAFGSESRCETVERLGIVCSCITNSSLQRVLVDLHNKLGELSPNKDKWFSEQFRSIQEEIEYDVCDYNYFTDRIQDLLS